MSTSSAVSVVSSAGMSVPRSIVPDSLRMNRLAWIGSVFPVRLNASRAPKIAAFVSRMSCCVSIISRSEPPSISAPACSSKTSTSFAKLMSPRVGSSDAGRNPVGPIEPATKRSSPAALRAISAAFVLISTVCSARPHSSSFRRLPWKVSVSRTSAPASSMEVWTPSITSGRFSTSASWHLPLSPP